MTRVSRLSLALLAGLAASSPALAVENFDNVTFANFAQSSGAKLFMYDRVGESNTISMTAPVNFNAIQIGPNTSFNATATLFATSTSTFFQNGAQFEQGGFNGSISFTNLAQGNLLTATFQNATISFDGAGTSGSIISSDPNDTMTFTSDLLEVSGFTSRDMAFNLTGADQTFAVEGGFGMPFNANLGGAFSGAPEFVSEVPEPSSWAMLIVGFGLVGSAARRRHAKLATITA